MSKHTPGPWHLASSIVAWEVYGQNDKHVVSVANEATARLIAAAPDLLAVAKKIAFSGTAHKLPLAQYQDLMAVIAQVEGER